MDKRTLGLRLGEKANLSGQFKLRSGKLATSYFDKYQFESIPDLLKPVSQLMSAMVPRSVEVLAALELGGVPIGTSMSAALNLPVVFVRKSRKEYGTCRQVEGVGVEGKRVCIVEDVITSGGSVLRAIDALRDGGADVTDVLSVVWRGDSEAEGRLVDCGVNVGWLFEHEEVSSRASK